MGNWAAFWRVFVSALAGYGAGAGAAALLPRTPESVWLPAGALCGIGGVVLGFAAGVLWVTRREAMDERPVPGSAVFTAETLRAAVDPDLPAGVIAIQDADGRWWRYPLSEFTEDTDG